MRYFWWVVFLLSFSPAAAQYAPQQGLAGSTAISASNGIFTEWASGCVLQRGYLYIDSPSLGYVSFGDSSLALGPADYSVVSLGDSGVADLTFPALIYNGPGADFAVFENGFINPANDSQAFLELAFVEVSSDGVHYVRFPAQSLTQTGTQIPASGVYMYANNINNLAGKYRSGYGTPFDLDELAGHPGLDVNHITHVRVVDVIGDIGNHAAHDSSGRVINDPYPTKFATGGFDLDAVGVINHIPNAGINYMKGDLQVSVYPNPVSGIMSVEINGSAQVFSAQLTTTFGSVLQEISGQREKGQMDISLYPAGIYYLVVRDASGNRCIRKILKY